MSKANKPSRPVSQRARRKFLRSVALGVGIIGASLLGFIPVLQQWVVRLRPPGALLEQKFLASCIKCGQCVQVCPVEAIKLAELDDGFGVVARISMPARRPAIFPVMVCNASWPVRPVP